MENLTEKERKLLVHVLNCRFDDLQDDIDELGDAEDIATQKAVAKLRDKLLIPNPAIRLLEAMHEAIGLEDEGWQESIKEFWIADIKEGTRTVEEVGRDIGLCIRRNHLFPKTYDGWQYYDSYLLQSGKETERTDDIEVALDIFEDWMRDEVHWPIRVFGCKDGKQTPLLDWMWKQGELSKHLQVPPDLI